MDSGIIGTYVLALWLAETQRLSVGRLGRFEFPAGWYLYVGSALGPGGLPARLARHQRHLSAGKRPHWHVDYVREQAAWGGAWARVSAQRAECAWATTLHWLLEATIVARGLGASDCRCPAHLVCVPHLPTDEWFARELGAERMRVGNSELDELLDVLTSGDDESREQVALALGRFGPEAAAPLSRLLNEEDVAARWWAARALAETGGQAAVQALSGALADADPDVRACAALALGRTGEGSAALPLVGALADESAFVASVASDALSMLGEPAIEVLAGRIEDKSAHVRLLAVRALGRIRSEKAIAPLLAVQEDPSYLVRYYAREALEALEVGLVFVAL